MTSNKVKEGALLPVYWCFFRLTAAKLSVDLLEVLRWNVPRILLYQSLSVYQVSYENINVQNRHVVSNNRYHRNFLDWSTYVAVDDAILRNLRLSNPYTCSRSDGCGPRFGDL